MAHHLEALALSLSPAEQLALLERVIALGDQKQRVRREDLPSLLRDAALERLGDRGEAGPAPLVARI